MVELKYMCNKNIHDYSIIIDGIPKNKEIKTYFIFELKGEGNEHI